MKNLFILIAILYTGTAFAQEMNVHLNNGTTNSYSLSQIDSITFTVSSIPTNGLVAYYPFNGNTNDESGNGYNGTNNGAILATDRFGNSNSAYSFDGNSNIILPNTENLNFNGGGFTLTSWVNFTSNLSDNCILAKHIWAVGSGYILNVYENKLTFYLPGVDRLSSDGTYNDGNWHFLVGVFDGTTQYLYVDGNLKKTQVGAIIIDNDTNITIGSAADNGYFEGSSDDIRIYNRALSSEEVNQLFHENGW